MNLICATIVSKIDLVEKPDSLQNLRSCSIQQHTSCDGCTQKCWTYPVVGVPRNVGDILQLVYLEMFGILLLLRKLVFVKHCLLSTKQTQPLVNSLQFRAFKQKLDLHGESFLTQTQLKCQYAVYALTIDFHTEQGPEGQRGLSCCQTVCQRVSGSYHHQHFLCPGLSCPCCWTVFGDLLSWLLCLL